MALNKKTPAPAFENPDDDNGEQTQTVSAADRLRAAAAERAAEAAAAEKAADKSADKSEDKPASTERRVATQSAGAGQVAAVRAMVDPLETLKDVFPVEFDTLPSIQLNQGNAMYKDTNAMLGDEIGLELLSYQDQTVCSPGVDGDEAKEHVRYSDDGITATNGDDMAEHLAKLKAAGYDKASLSKRVVIVGSLFDPGVKGAKIAGMRDKLVQINLAPSSVKGFKGYRAQEAFKIGKGLAKIEGVERVRITCTVKKHGDNSYTVGEFTRYSETAE